MSVVTFLLSVSLLISLGNAGSAGSASGGPVPFYPSGKVEPSLLCLSDRDCVQGCAVAAPHSLSLTLSVRASLHPIDRNL